MYPGKGITHVDVRDMQLDKASAPLGKLQASMTVHLQHVRNMQENAAGQRHIDETLT